MAKKGTAGATRAASPALKTSGGAASPGTSGGQNSSTTSTPGLEVISTHDGFRRAGLVWGKQPVVVKFADLSEEQVDMLFNEPGLTVTEVDVPVEAEGE